jgi:hypothetical protein
MRKRLILSGIVLVCMLIHPHLAFVQADNDDGFIETLAWM